VGAPRNIDAKTPGQSFRRWLAPLIVFVGWVSIEVDEALFVRNPNDRRRPPISNSCHAIRTGLAIRTFSGGSLCPLLEGRQLKKLSLGRVASPDARPTSQPYETIASTLRKNGSSGVHSAC